MTSSILWQSQDRTVTLIDIPRSIVAAQGNDGVHLSHQLLSTPPLQYPFSTNEPKSASARAKLQTNSAEREIHRQYHDLLQKAIGKVHTEYGGNWYLPRLLVDESSLLAKKRRLDDASTEFPTMHSDAAGRPNERPTLPDHFLSDIARDTVRNHNVRSLGELNAYHGSNEHVRDVNQSSTHAFNNTSQESTTVQIHTADAAEVFAFYVPANTSFYLGNCVQSKDFRNTVRKQAELSRSRSLFDFILLDPPWPNRSVKRTHKTAGSTYSTAPSLEDVQDLILGTHLDILMADRCFVAIWITNKQSVRELVLGENGVFDCWNVDVVEEWVWLKTTGKGEPVTPLDGVWRKPYEVLLLGKRKALGRNSLNDDRNSIDVKRRVIIGVPDLHSRKPCLKALIEPMMQDPADYRALEVFARHLVAGWWSWGDECIKFNWEGYWRRETKENEL